MPEYYSIYEPTHTVSKYLIFEEDDHWERKTKRIVVVSKRKLTVLGDIRWWPPWRQYVFFPESNTLWNVECMRDIQECIKRLMDERKLPCGATDYNDPPPICNLPKGHEGWHREIRDGKLWAEWRVDSRTTED